MYSDASKNLSLGFGATCMGSWMYKRREIGYIKKYDPSIEYLELFALVAGVLAWVERYCNRRIVLFCDNKSVCAMVNSTTSSCRNCMVLIRILVLHCMVNNVRVFAKYIKSKQNRIADLLSRMRIRHFKSIGQCKCEMEPTQVPVQI